MRAGKFLLLLCVWLISSCASAPTDSRVATRNAAILSEEQGDYWIGRRYYVSGPQGQTRFWGYLRRPTQSWNQALLVIMRENRLKTPDRLPEAPVHGPAHGFDQNYEYRIEGQFTGRKIYDPNADLELSEFEPSKYTVLNIQPGFLFKPQDAEDQRQYLPGREYQHTTPARM